MSMLCVDVNVLNLAKAFLADDNENGDGIRRGWLEKDAGALAGRIQETIEDFMDGQQVRHDLGEQVKRSEESFEKLRAERDEARADADALRQRAEGVEQNFASVATLTPDASALLRWRNELDEARAALAKLRMALAPLVAIADAYDANALDDEARKFYGQNSEFANDGVPPGHIELYNGRGGKRLLTLAHCLDAREALRRSTR